MTTAIFEDIVMAGKMYDSFGKLIGPPFGGGGGGPAAGFGIQSLRGTTPLATPAPNTITFSFSSGFLTDGLGNTIYIQGGFTKTIDISTVGMNGRDSGINYNLGSDIYIYLISDGVNVSLISSTSNVSPTLPIGYTYFTLISAVKGWGFNNTIPMTQRGRDILLAPQGAFAAAVNPAAFTAYSFATYAPVGISKVLINASLGNGLSTNTTLIMEIASSDDTTLPSFNVCHIIAPPAGALLDLGLFPVTMFPIDSRIWVRTNQTNSYAYLTVSGYSI